VEAIDTGVQERDIEAAGAAPHDGHDLVPQRGVGNASSHSVAADGGCHCGDGLRIDVDRHDVRTLARESLTGSAADAGACAGDDDVLLMKAHEATVTLGSRSTSVVDHADGITSPA
jgi:hypothetical protein